MSEPMKDMSLSRDLMSVDYRTDAAAIRCGNAECDYYDTRYTDQCCAESTSPVGVCAGYRPAEPNADDGKPTTQPPDAANTLRTERDQARAELAQIRRALELTGTVLPEIDEAAWEYSGKGQKLNGEWREAYIDGEWVSSTDTITDFECLLTRRRRRVRRAPTDADAVAMPRRECWVRDNRDVDWIPAQLLGVREGGDEFVVRLPDGTIHGYYMCEIEVES